MQEQYKNATLYARCKPLLQESNDDNDSRSGAEMHLPTVSPLTKRSASRGVVRTQESASHRVLSYSTAGFIDARSARYDHPSVFSNNRLDSLARIAVCRYR
jgi:hypothetical protein